MIVLHSSVPTFELPPNIPEMLDCSLIYDETLNAKHRNTEKYFVEDRPDLFVRHLPRESVYSALRAADQLPQHGVSVLPYHVIEYDKEEWVITKRVTGENLDRALAEDRGKDSGLVAAVDRIWAGLTRYLVTAKQQGLPIASDIETPVQYMRGTIDFGDRAPRVWLTDLPQFVRYPAEDPVDYAEQVLYLAGGIVEIEDISGEESNLARKAIRAATAHIDSNFRWPRQLKLATQYVLGHNVVLNPHDDSDQIEAMTP